MGEKASHISLMLSRLPKKRKNKDRNDPSFIDVSHTYYLLAFPMSKIEKKAKIRMNTSFFFLFGDQPNINNKITG